IDGCQIQEAPLQPGNCLQVGASRLILRTEAEAVEKSGAVANVSPHPPRFDVPRLSPLPARTPVEPAISIPAAYRQRQGICKTRKAAVALVTLAMAIFGTWLFIRHSDQS